MLVQGDSALQRKRRLRDVFSDRGYLTQSSCNKLFRRSLFERIKYKKGIINEDMEMLLRLLDISENIIVLDKVIYNLL